MSDQTTIIRQKDKTIAIVLALFLGGFGAHKFYLDRPGIGVMYALFFWTLIPAFVAFVDIIVLLMMDRKRFDQEYNGK